MEKTLKFAPVDCEKGDIVKIATIQMEVSPDLYKVCKRGKNLVHLAKVGTDSKSFSIQKSRVVEIVQEAEREIKNNDSPKIGSNQIIFKLDQYLSTFESGYELWTMKRKSTYTNILIESNKKSFWYFKTDENGRPKKKFFGEIPARIGRHCKNINYDKKIASLVSQGFTRKK